LSAINVKRKVISEEDVRTNGAPIAKSLGMDSKIATYTVSWER